MFECSCKDKREVIELCQKLLGKLRWKQMKKVWLRFSVIDANQGLKWIVHICRIKNEKLSQSRRLPPLSGGE